MEVVGYILAAAQKRNSLSVHEYHKNDDSANKVINADKVFNADSANKVMNADSANKVK